MSTLTPEETAPIDTGETFDPFALNIEFIENTPAADTPATRPATNSLVRASSRAVPDERPDLASFESRSGPRQRA